LKSIETRQVDRLSPIAYRLSPITYHLSPIAYHGRVLTFSTSTSPPATLNAVL